MTEIETSSLKFFVYGSWTQGFVHFEKLKNYVSRIEEASICGKACRLKAGFPVVLEDGQDQVSGQILTITSSDFLVNLLDEFHGFSQLDPAKSLFFRKKTKARVMSSDQDFEQEVWTYFMNPAKLPKNSSVIPGGRWKESLKNEPPLTEKLTERQRHYIQRLGQSTGREIVPIDLPLYRELMNLELIVDKGRRLALSKTGNEVFKYLS